MQEPYRRLYWIPARDPRGELCPLAMCEVIDTELRAGNGVRFLQTAQGVRALVVGPGRLVLPATGEELAVAPCYQAALRTDAVGRPG